MTGPELAEAHGTSLEPGPEETLDAICGGRVQLLQRRHGYRFNLDPILLARFACPRGGCLSGRVIDLGTGSGIIPLLLARKHGVESTGLELQSSLFELAERNVHLNRAEHRVSLVHGDLRDVRELFPRASFRHVLGNPPYHRWKGGRTNPSTEKAIARHEIACSLQDVARAARYLLEPLGSLWLIFPASRLVELLAAVCAAKLAPRRLRLVHPRLDEPARRVLLHAVKQGRGTLEVLPPLVLHPGQEASFSDEVQAALS